MVRWTAIEQSSRVHIYKKKQFKMFNMCTALCDTKRNNAPLKFH